MQWVAALMFLWPLFLHCSFCPCVTSVSARSFREMSCPPFQQCAVPQPLGRACNTLSIMQRSPPLHSHNQDALQPRAKKDKHATFTSPPPHLLPSAATPLRGSPMPSAAAGAGHNGGLSPSVLNQGVTHQSLSSKAEGSGRFGPGGRGDVHAKIDVRL